MDVIDWYRENRPIYKMLASKVESLLTEVFEIENISFHIITSRAKEIESLKVKVSKGKYDKPIDQVHDFAGIRVITYVEDEIDKVCNVIEKTFTIDKKNSSNKSDELGLDKVGYKSVHYVASLDKNRLKLPEYKQYINKCFEIQVRTILQHAWAEIEHDRNYKFSGKLPPDIGRRFKILAGVLEMADREFNNIANEIDSIAIDTLKSAQKGVLNIPISSTTLTQYFANKFKILAGSKDKFIPDTDEDVVNEMEIFGLHTLEEFDQIIPDYLESSLMELSDKVGLIYETGLVRRVLILHDYNKYFAQVIDEKSANDWVWAPSGHGEAEKEFFLQCGLDWAKIEKKYKVRISY